MIIEPRYTQIRIGLAYPPTPHEMETRYRCIEARHEGVLYNSNADATFCLCGRAVRQGDCGRRPSRYEWAEQQASRPDPVGTEARRFLDIVHGKPVPRGPVHAVMCTPFGAPSDSWAVLLEFLHGPRGVGPEPSAVGEQYVFDGLEVAS